MKNREEIVISDNPFLNRFTIKRKHDEKDLVAEEPVLEPAVERKNRCVILSGVRRALLKVQRKNRKPVARIFNRRRSSCQAKQLEELPPVLFAVLIIS